MSRREGCGVCVQSFGHGGGVVGGFVGVHVSAFVQETITVCVTNDFKMSGGVRP